MRSELFAESNFEPSGSWEVFHSKMLRVVVTPDEPLYATKGPWSPIRATDSSSDITQAPRGCPA